MTTSTTKRQVRRARVRKFFAKQSTPMQQAAMRAGDPVEQAREKYRFKIRPGTPAACLICSRFLGQGGGCNGVPAPAGTTPPCHENAFTGQHAQPAEWVEGVGWRLKTGQERFYGIEAIGKTSAIVAPRRR